ncbi:MAG: BMP family ABC transporter substrate-binding protein [Oscillospiraceae bacterium]|nr:BMP family ABC transporter substrate-binding protein [Oscillospiraceae bacterium]
MKKTIALLLALVLVFALCACNANKQTASGSDLSTNVPQNNGEEKQPDEGKTEEDASALKIGVILLHDESIGYDFAHMEGIQKACSSLGIDYNDNTKVIWKYNISESEACYDAAVDLAEHGCNLIISDSYGHQSYMTEAAKEYPDVTFLIATGDTAAVDGLENTRNFFTHTYESRYVSGVVAGMKLAQMVDDGLLTDANYNADGNIKIGYVGAFPYAEVVSGYTAFYLGVKSIVPNVEMDVTFTNSWANATAEQQAAVALLARGCAIISQHADSTGGPAAIEAEIATGSVCAYVGYNIDMLAVAPTAILTSAQNNWAAYYTYAIGLAKDGKASDIAVDWSEGYETGANMISTLGSSCAPGTAEKVAEVEAAIKDGSLKVFDTDTFTVGGEKLESYIFNTSTMNSDFTAVQYVGEDYECIIDGAFAESVFRSAPYFGIDIDGINKLD